MRILANENITGSVIEELRQRGHDVLAVKESMRGEQDDVILARAQAEERILITQDKDFGELAFRSHWPQPVASSCSDWAGATRRPTINEYSTRWPGEAIGLGTLPL